LAKKKKATIAKILDEKWLLGHIEYFDEDTGRGYARDEHGNRFFLHYSAIKSNKKYKTLSRNQDVKFTLHRVPGEVIIKKLIEV